MNAHPQLGLILAGPLEPVALPGEIAHASAELAFTPTRAIAEVTVPDMARAAPPRFPRRATFRRAALAVSVVLHVAAAWAIGEKVMRGPVEAEEPQAVSVEIVIEAPAPAAEPASAEAASGAKTDAEAPADAPPSFEVPDFDPALAMTPPPVVAPAPAPVFDAPPPAAEMLALLATPPRLPEPEHAAPPLPEAKPELKPAETMKQASRPAPHQPAETPAVSRKAPEKTAVAKARPETAKPEKPKAKAADAKPARTEKPAAKTKANAATRTDPKGESTSARPGAATAKAGKAGAAKAGPVSAAAKSAFSAKLLAHVQRFKRHPAAAKGASGTARLVVTIGRDGGLRGAKLAGSAGNAALDAEALATARRAAPYPRPPEGLGGATISFGVSIRFTR